MSALIAMPVFLLARYLPLEKQSEVLKNKITYLEDFKLIEYDRNNAAILLRSRVPQQLGNAVRYYEIVLKRGNRLSFGRYEFDRGTGRRRVIPANLASEMFERLLVDFESLFTVLSPNGCNPCSQGKEALSKGRPFLFGRQVYCLITRRRNG